MFSTTPASPLFDAILQQLEIEDVKDIKPNEKTFKVKFTDEEDEFTGEIQLFAYNEILVGLEMKKTKGDRFKFIDFCDKIKEVIDIEKLEEEQEEEAEEQEES